MDSAKQFFDAGLTAAETDIYNKIVAMSEQSAILLDMNSYYASYQTFYKEEIASLLANLNIELVVYDETEYFRQFYEPLFNYPYTLRKTNLGTVSFVIPDDSNDYYFSSIDTKFFRSEVCMEPSVLDQIHFLGELRASVAWAIETYYYNNTEKD